MMIHLTQNHIDQGRLVGKPGLFLDKFSDPVTLAIRDATKGNRVMTHPRTVEIDGKFFDLPESVVKWTTDWCNGIIGQPFSFEITPTVVIPRKSK